MKIYRASWYQTAGDGKGGLNPEGGDDGRMVAWFTSQRAAARFIAEQKRTGNAAPSGPTNVQGYDLKLTQAGIVAWLNLHFTTDNG